jgi:hypothetical protein
MTSPRPYRWPPSWFENFLAKDSGRSASDFIIEAWVVKRWRRIARSEYEATARSLFKQLSYMSHGYPAPPAPWLGGLDQDAH